MKQGEERSDSFQLDVVVAASGFSKKEMKTLEEVRLHSIWVWKPYGALGHTVTDGILPFFVLYINIVHGKCQRRDEE